MRTEAVRAAEMYDDMGDIVLIRSSGQELASIKIRSIKTRIGPKLWSESEVSLHLQAGLAKRFHQRH